MSDIVYLDVCCFKRPFDDATQDRVRVEAERVAAALEAASQGRIRLVRSPAHDFENARNPREDRRLATRLWLEGAALRAPASAASVARARTLVGLGFAALDALHLAYAEAAAARWFVTTDDRLLKRARARQSELRVEVVDPPHLPLSAEGDAV